MDLSKDMFKGCLVGALIGDCLGAPFECKYWEFDGVAKERIFQKLGLNNTDGEILSDSNRKKRFTDDSSMTRSVALSFIKTRKFNNVDMALRFSKEYYKEKFRGYGGDVTKIFAQWRSDKITKENILIPSKSQFDGSGSYGNGGAMRVSPVALFSISIEECIKVARETAILTHSNKHGYNGAILQALAVYFALIEDRSTQFDTFSFIGKLKSEMFKLEGDYKNPESYDLEDYIYSEEFTYAHQLDIISDLLKLNKDISYEESVQNTIQKLGHGVIAMESVPAALYSFLHNVNNGFQETLYFAISVGGDTDTIASMACAIAGAYHGIQNIPFSWISVSESSEDFIQYGEKLFELQNDRKALKK